MSFEFRDETNTKISSASMKRLISTLEASGEVTFTVYTTESTKKPGIYISAATSLGEVDYPSLNSPHTDYNDLLLYGSNTLTPSGLKVVKVENPETNPVETEVFFNYSQGAAYKNMISLPQLENLPANSYAQVKIKYIANQEISSRRLYVRLNIDDSE